MRSFLITGGAGFIGSNLVHYILEKYQDDKIVVLDNLTYAGNLLNLKKWENDKRFKFIKGDISNKQEIEKIVNSYNFTHVAHLAAESHVDRSISGPEVFIQTNVVGTFNLLEAFKNKWGIDKEKVFLHVSTDEVFGSLGEEGFFTESTPYKPNSPYSASKAGSDHLVRAYFHTYGLNVITTNCSNNYGPYQFPEKLIPLLILNCLAGKELPVYGKGENVRDWLYVEDHCSAIDTVLQKGKAGETYNIGTRNEKKNIEVVEKVCEIMDKLDSKSHPHKDLIRYVTDRPGHDLRYAIDPNKIETELGWKPKFSFEEAFEITIKWYLENKNWWEPIINGEYKNYYNNLYNQRIEK